MVNLLADDANERDPRAEPRFIERMRTHRAGAAGTCTTRESAAAGSRGGPAPPDPPGRPPQPGQPSGDEDTEALTRPKTAVPKRYKVIFHNDDFTTMEFVVEVLRRFFHKSDSEAVHVMLTVHKKGKAVAGVYTRDVAETKVAEVMSHAREQGMPLLLTTEPE